MKKTFIAIRDVDLEIYKKFRARAVANRVNLGKAITIAMKKDIESQDHVKKKNILSLNEIKGIIKLKQKVRWSEEVDEALYG